MPHPEIILFFFFIALIYSSVGFGGGSSYLAILALYEMPFKEMRLIALICNIIVVLGGTINFFRHKQYSLKKILPIIIVSIPMAFVGASLKISANTFFILLGCSLIVAAGLLWIPGRRNSQDLSEFKGHLSPVANGLIGGIVGLLSGMVGIGGGIFLSPILNLRKWGTSRQIAAAASLFILVNSLSGIAGQITSGYTVDSTRLLLLGGAVLAGGQIGSYIGITKFNLLLIRRITALLVFIAGTEVLIKHVF